MSKPILAITMGDPAGIGPEIAVKALEHAQLYKECIPVVIGDYEPIREAATFCNSSLKIHCIKEPQEALGSHGTIDFIDLGLLAPRSWEYKKVSAATGDASYRYIERAISLALNKSVHGVCDRTHQQRSDQSGRASLFRAYGDLCRADGM